MLDHVTSQPKTLPLLPFFQSNWQSPNNGLRVPPFPHQPPNMPRIYSKRIEIFVCVSPLLALKEGLNKPIIKETIKN